MGIFGKLFNPEPPTREQVVANIEYLEPRANKIYKSRSYKWSETLQTSVGKKYSKNIALLRDFDMEEYGFWWSYRRRRSDNFEDGSMNVVRMHEKPSKQARDFYLKLVDLYDVGFEVYYKGTGQYQFKYEHDLNSDVKRVNAAHERYVVNKEMPDFTDGFRIGEDGSPAGESVSQASEISFSLGDMFFNSPTLSNESRSKSKSKDSIKRFGRDLIEEAREGRLDICIGRETQMAQLEMILARKKKANPVLVGEAGTGKSQIVYGLAHTLADPSYNGMLKGKDLIELSIAKIMSGMKFVGALEQRMDDIIKSVEGTDTILFIDELHTMMGAGATSNDQNGDISNMLKPYLADGRLSVIGATTSNEYQYIISDPAMERRFNRIDVNEVTYEETTEILKKVKISYEEHHKVKYTPKVLDVLPFVAKNYTENRLNPDVSIDFMDSLGVYARQKGFDKVSIELLRNMFEEYYNESSLVEDRELDNKQTIGFKINR